MYFITKLAPPSARRSAAPGRNRAPPSAQTSRGRAFGRAAIKSFSCPIAAAMLGALLVASLAAPAAAQEYKVIVANLYGKEAAGGGDAEEGAGDFDGEIDFPQARLCYYLDFFDIDAPTEAHIHEGEESAKSGPAVLTLPLPAESGDEACADAAVDLLRAIAAQPANYYVDIHTAEFAEGAIRGQLRD